MSDYYNFETATGKLKSRTKSEDFGVTATFSFFITDNVYTSYFKDIETGSLVTTLTVTKDNASKTVVTTFNNLSLLTSGNYAWELFQKDVTGFDVRLYRLTFNLKP